MLLFFSMSQGQL